MALPGQSSQVLIATTDKNIAGPWLAAFKRAGFDDVGSATSIEKAIAKAMTSPVNWIVATLSPGARFTGFNLLHRIVQNPATRHIRVSLIVDDTDFETLPTLYANGLLNHFELTTNEKDASDQINTFLKACVTSTENDIIVSGHYLRLYLKSQKSYEKWLRMERAICDAIPNQPQLLIPYAEALVACGESAAARDVLAQAKFLNPRLSDQANKIRDRINANNPTSNQIDSAVNQLHDIGAGKKLAVVVDPDESAARFVARLLKKQSYLQVEVFDDVDRAWDFIKKSDPPDLIVHEWRLPNLGGMAFVQRIRSFGLRDTTIVVTSALLEPSDKPLLEEMSVSTIVTKPINQENFALAMRWLRSQQRRPTNQVALESKIEGLLRRNEANSAENLKVVYMADSNISEARKLIMRARFLYHYGEYQAAKEELIAGTSLAIREPLDAINLLGKCFYQLKQPRLALQCFQKAQKLSPHNILRLCQIADAHIELEEFRESRQALRRAETLDNENQDVVATSTKLAFAEQQVDAARSLMHKLKRTEAIIGYMNNKAVATVVSGEIEKGIGMYKFTVMLIPRERRDLLSILYYNLGLGFARTGKLNLAEYSLKDALEHPTARIERKAKSLLQRIIDSNKRGSDLVLYGDDTESSNQDAFDIDFEPIAMEQFQITPAAIEVEPGKYGLIGIIPLPERHSKLTQSLIDKINDEDQSAA